MSFIGECNIFPENMLDYEDRLNKQEIKGKKMLHFITEIFDGSILSAVLWQRLFASIVLEELQKSVCESRSTVNDKRNFRRSGDDIYVGKHKLSISIATKSLVSTLIHFALNITNDETPIKTKSLNDFKINPELFAKHILKLFTKEYKSVKIAQVKVKPV